MENSTLVTVKASVNAPVAKVWEKWTNPADIVNWNAASEDWHTTKAENDPRTGGHFSSRMEAKDGSMGFDFAGVYDNVIPHELITYSLGEERKVKIIFEADGDVTHITESFDAENTHPVEFQQAGWQAILDNFKRYTEASV